MNQQRRGWVALGSGIFLIAFIAAIAIWVDRILSAYGLLRRDAKQLSLLGESTSPSTG